MKQKNNTNLILALSISFALIACNQQKTTDESAKTDEAKTETASMPGYDPALDATKLPGYPARILADSLNLKAYEFVVNPGDSVPMHSHPDHVLYVLEGGTGEITGKDGNVQVLDLKAGTALIFGPATHSAKITGTTTVKLLVVHVYRPRS